MEKCSGLTSLWLTGDARNQEGVVLTIGNSVAALMILRKIGSPFLNYNFLEGNLLYCTWVKVAAALGGLGALGLAQAHPCVGNANKQTLGNHFSALLRQIAQQGIRLGVFVGFGYIFPRVSSFFLVSQIVCQTGFLGIQTGRNILKSNKAPSFDTENFN